jgi:hypothetical protein
MNRDSSEIDFADWGDIPDEEVDKQIDQSFRDAKTNRKIRDAGARAIFEYWDPTTNRRLKKEDMIKKFGPKLTDECYDGRNGYSKNLIKALYDTQKIKKTDNVEAEKKKAVAAERRRNTLAKKKSEEEAKIEAMKAPHYDKEMQNAIAIHPIEITLEHMDSAYNERQKAGNCTMIPNNLINGEIMTPNEYFIMSLLFSNRPWVKTGQSDKKMILPTEAASFYKTGKIAVRIKRKDLANTMNVSLPTLRKTLAGMLNQGMVEIVKKDGAEYIIIGEIVDGKEVYFYSKLLQ